MIYRETESSFLLFEFARVNSSKSDFSSINFQLDLSDIIDFANFKGNKQ